MTRPWIVCASTAAFAAGMMLVHCSSSSSTGTGSDAGTGHDAKGAGTGTGTGTATGPGSSTGSGTSATSGTGTGTGSGSSTTSGTGSGPASGSGSGLTDTHDAGPCVGPTGGAACDPGNVECNNMQCAVPGHVCCDDGTTPACVGVTATCGTPITCDEKSDCPDGQFCCLVATSLSAFTITCQTAACTVNNVGSTQVCKTNAECPNGACNIYSCGNPAQVTEACASPSTFDCTQM
jgi:hypothetical protein